MQAFSNSAAKATGWNCYFSCTRWVLWETTSPVAFWQECRGIRWIQGVSLAWHWQRFYCSMSFRAPKALVLQGIIEEAVEARALIHFWSEREAVLKLTRSLTSSARTTSSNQKPPRSEPSNVQPRLRLPLHISNLWCTTRPDAIKAQHCTPNLSLWAEPCQILSAGTCREACIEPRLDSFRSKPCFVAS